LAVLTTFGVVIGAYYTVQTAVTSGDPIAQADNTGSVAWRVEGWAVLISQWAKSSMNWFTGEPFGTGFLRVVEGSNVVAGPHNFYVEMLLRTGIAGLLALFALTAGLLIATWRKSMPDAGVFGSGVLAALLMMQLVWFVTWTPGIEQGIVTGIAISLAAYAAEKTPLSQPRERSLDSRSAG
jgi:O-antigen ligase